MLFPFQCQGCGKRFDGEYPIGKAPRVIPCPSCKKDAKRIYEGTSIAVKIGGSFCRSSSFGEQMKARNVQAGHRMKGQRPGLMPVAHDFGGGDIREIKKAK